MILVRHADNDYVRSGKLAGWTPNVHLNEHGMAQANSLGQRLSSFPLRAIYSSPLERALETAQAALEHHHKISLKVDHRLGEVKYGTWTGKKIRALARTRLWQVVQNHPSLARFPGGESLREVQSRAVEGIEDIVSTFPRGTVLAVSHGDVIKSLIAHYSGIHLDQFQRISVAPASISIIEIGRSGSILVRLNDTCHCDQRNDS
jgi:probable phosphomutase (TIGR03848 family)